MEPSCGRGRGLAVQDPVGLPRLRLGELRLHLGHLGRGVAQLLLELRDAFRAEVAGFGHGRTSCVGLSMRPRTSSSHLNPGPPAPAVFHGPASAAVMQTSAGAPSSSVPERGLLLREVRPALEMHRHRHLGADQLDRPDRVAAVHRVAERAGDREPHPAEVQQRSVYVEPVRDLADAAVEDVSPDIQSERCQPSACTENPTTSPTIGLLSGGPCRQGVAVTASDGLPGRSTCTVSQAFMPVA